jgi:hypothetical protein
VPAAQIVQPESTMTIVPRKSRTIEVRSCMLDLADDSSLPGVLASDPRAVPSRGLSSAIVVDHLSATHSSELAETP